MTDSTQKLKSELRQVVAEFTELQNSPGWKRYCETLEAQLHNRRATLLHTKQSSPDDACATEYTRGEYAFGSIAIALVPGAISAAEFKLEELKDQTHGD